ncbi:hypothetical protein GCK72_021890 [Caenorhabditis remanei]|uniref:Uncharacterized protein n=1 Tax=Caenorhabditis remanei TaxID=31234 RepID=A0A6A5GL52_CAERE|nr:hypothetical protein GCK72_021890 [Caenorhabditis remanei]KAF1755321.1 hypothetical protein GCK72_021890 [Caenorhabditis remanei]
MVYTDFKFNFGDNEGGVMSVYAILLGYCEFNGRKTDKDKCLKDTFGRLEDDCRNDPTGGGHCKKVLDHAASTACGVLQNYGFCKGRPITSFETTETPTTTVTTTHQTVTDAPFPTGAVIGGVLLGALFSIIAMTLIFCLCKRKGSPGDEKNKVGTTTDSFGSSGTTNMSTSGGSTSTSGKKKNKKNKKKKEKKAKKGKKSGTTTKSTTQTNTASAY